MATYFGDYNLVYNLEHNHTPVKRFISTTLSFLLSAPILLFLLSTPTVQSTDYFVDNSCSQNGNGLSTSCATSDGGSGAFNSLSQAETSVTGDQSGNRLLLKSGQTFSGQFTPNAYGTPNHPFTISAYGSGNKPIIAGGNANLKISCPNCQYIIVDGLEFTASTGEWSANVYIQYPAHHITIQNSYSHHSPYRGILIENSSYNTIDSNEVSYNTSRGGDGIEVDKLSSSPQPTINNTISNNTVHHNSFYGISVSGPYFNNLDGTGTRIFGNESYNNSTGIYLISADGIEIYNNYLHDNGRDCQGSNDCASEPYGFAIQSGSFNSFHDNIIKRSYNTGLAIYGDNGVTSGPANGNKIYRNFISETIRGESWQRDVDWEAYTNQSVGSNNQVYYNIVTGQGDNFHVNDDDPSTSGNVAYNNIFHGGQTGIAFIGTTGNAGWTLANNIFSNNSQYSVYAPNLSGGLTLTNNIYYKENGGTLVYYNHNNYNQSNISSLDATAVTSNPQFTSPANWTGFQLLPNSPAINAGTNLGSPFSQAFLPGTNSWPATTADQNNFGSAWEIGAFVFTDNSSPTPSPTPSAYPAD